MSCNCPIDKDVKDLTVPLTDADIIKIRSGGVVDAHFHGPTFHMKRLTLLFSLPQYLPRQNSAIALECMKLGDVRPCPLTDQEIQHVIDSDGAFQTPLGDGIHSIWITTEKARKRLEREMKQLKNQ